MQTSAGRDRLLIVEDEAVVALDLKGELEAMGYEVVGVADTAFDALELARRHAPTLALMDIMLKGDTDGIGAAEAMREQLGTPVIFLTSYSDGDTVSRAARTGAYGYLTKPFQAKELRAGIEVALWKSRMERQLREADRWFALTLRCVQDGVAVTDADGALRFLNTAAERLTGWHHEQALGVPIERVVRFDGSAGDATAPVRRAMQEGRVLGVRHDRLLLAADGRRTAVDESVAPVRDDFGHCLGAVVVLRDATDRQRQQALLRGSEERFRRAFDGAPLGMALVGFDGRFLQVNDALCSLLGFDARLLCQRTQDEVTPAEDQAHERARLAQLQAGTQTVVQFEKRYLRAPDATPVWALVHASLLSPDQGPDGWPAAYLYQVHDLSTQKQAAEQLAALTAQRLKNEADERLGRQRNAFLSRVSHEMRTPLNAVLGFAELLRQQQVRGQPADPAYPEHILQAGRHLLALVDDVLDLQRAEEGRLSLRRAPVVLDDVLPGLVTMLGVTAQPRDVRIALELVPGLSIEADETRLRQIFLNLGSNAVKYNVPGGQVRIVGRREGEEVRIEVIDTGIGMTPEQLAHLFEPFNRLGREALRVPGVGLGLVISRSLVQQMGGRLALSSEPGRGTTAVLSFPAAP